MKRLRDFIQEKLENFGISMVVEMAQINTKDDSNSYFPYNKYKICIYGDDHIPAHFHIISKQEGFDIRINCVSGELVSVKKYGKRKKDSHFMDIIKDVKKWLDEPTPNKLYPGIDNRDVVKIHWNANNPELEIE